jgi:hypothetical protein
MRTGPVAKPQAHDKPRGGVKTCGAASGSIAQQRPPDAYLSKK